MHPHFPECDYFGTVTIPEAKALWVLFDQRCATVAPVMPRDQSDQVFFEQAR